MIIKTYIFKRTEEISLKKEREREKFKFKKELYYIIALENCVFTLSINANKNIS